MKKDGQQNKKDTPLFRESCKTIQDSLSYPVFPNKIKRKKTAKTDIKKARRNTPLPSFPLFIL